MSSYKEYKKKILFVTHMESKCGVYEFGKNIFNAIKSSEIYNFVKAECTTLQDLNDAIIKENPECVIYNYHPSVMPWLTKRIVKGTLYKSYLPKKKIPQVGIIHEVTQDLADSASKRNIIYIRDISDFAVSLFDYYIAPDPTLLLYNSIVYKTGRLIPSYDGNLNNENDIPVIGSFGLGTSNKGFEEIIKIVQKEFDVAEIRLNIPAADFGNPKKPFEIAEKCRSLVVKKGIKLAITHEFFDDNDLLKFLSKNTINAFLYKNELNRGLSSVTDYAIAVKRPVAISNASMFRHLYGIKPSICIDKNNLTQIISNGFSPLESIYKEWNSNILRWEYERILTSIFNRHVRVEIEKSIFKKIKYEAKRIIMPKKKQFSWLRSTSCENDDLTIDTTTTYNPVELLEKDSLNRILDNKARNLYAPAEKIIKSLVPITYRKKIPEANVQQAFVFDTVHRFMNDYKNPKILCIGSNEDTASMSLIKMGIKIDEIDPVYNYYLQDFTSKPTTKKGSYNIIFATSVIEHDPDDESFVKCIDELLAPGGVAILTCDYKDGWKPGDPKPDCDKRLYTKSDFTGRLLSIMKNFELVDVPNWDCPSPDFYYLGKYNYTFATFVVRKK